MDRSEFMPIALVSALAFLFGLLSLFVLPASIIGFPTPVLVLAGVGAAFLGAIRWL
jgi:hypothetical protein